MDAYTREELDTMMEYMRRQGKQVLKAYQIAGATEGMKTAGGIQGVSRGEAMDSVDYGPVQVQFGVIKTPQGVKILQAKQKIGREADIFDIDTNIRPEREEEGNELRRCGEDLKVRWKTW